MLVLGSSRNTLVSLGDTINTHSQQLYTSPHNRLEHILQGETAKAPALPFVSNNSNSNGCSHKYTLDTCPYVPIFRPFPVLLIQDNSGSLTITTVPLDHPSKTRLLHVTSVDYLASKFHRKILVFFGGGGVENPHI